MNLKISINLGDYEHINPTSNEHDTMEECARELIRELSKIKHYEVDLIFWRFAERHDNYLEILAKLKKESER